MSSNVSTHDDTAAGARLLVVLLAFAWGFNWVLSAVALRELSPWSLRVAGSSLGVATLFAVALVTGRNLRLPAGEYRHVLIAGFFNIAAFQVFSSFAQLTGATSRAIVITYSVPIWTAVLSCILLGERLTAIRVVALGLCIAGLAILVWPLFADGVPVFVFYSLGCAFSWAFATVYIKWARVTVPPLANAAWQLLFGLLFIIAGGLVSEGLPHLWPAKSMTIFAVLFVGVVGVGIAHFLWWSIVGKLPVITASLGALLVPVIGVSASALLLGERLTLTDMTGFALIFAAAACVLSQRRPSVAEMPE